MSKKIYVGNLPIKKIELKKKGFKLLIKDRSTVLAVEFGDESQRKKIESAKVLTVSFADDVPKDFVDDLISGTGNTELLGALVLAGWEEGVAADKVVRASNSNGLTLILGYTDAGRVTMSST